MSTRSCINCEEEWNLDPIYDEEGNPFCCEECRTMYNDSIPVIVITPENKNETLKES